MLDIIDHFNDNYQFCKTDTGLIFKIGLTKCREEEIEEELDILIDELQELMDFS